MPVESASPTSCASTLAKHAIRNYSSARRTSVRCRVIGKLNCCSGRGRMWVTVIRSSHSPLPKVDLSWMRGRLLVDVAVELKTGLWRTCQGSHNPPNPNVGNPDLGVPRYAADP